MSLAPVPVEKKASALAVMAARLNVEPAKLLSTLKNTVFSGANDDELLALVVVANEYGLNPIIREIFAFPKKGGGIVPVVSVDGWIKIANSHSAMDGIEYEWDHTAEGKLIACTSIVWRRDRSRPVRVTEFLEECRRATDPWKMEHRMLRHKATIQGFRVAFGFSGIYDEDEARDIVEVSATTRTPVEIAAPNFLTSTEPEAKAIAEQRVEPVTKAVSPVNEVGVNQNRLAALCAGEGASFDLFLEALQDMGQLEGNDANATAFADLSDKLCTRLLNAQAGLKRALAAKKPQGGVK
jgi:hypothetical protein